jgi:hypothetical protein
MVGAGNEVVVLVRAPVQ